MWKNPGIVPQTYNSEDNKAHSKKLLQDLQTVSDNEGYNCHY